MQRGQGAADLDEVRGRHNDRVIYLQCLTARTICHLSQVGEAQASSCSMRRAVLVTSRLQQSIRPPPSWHCSRPADTVTQQYYRDYTTHLFLCVIDVSA